MGGNHPKEEDFITVLGIKIQPLHAKICQEHIIKGIQVPSLSALFNIPASKIRTILRRAECREYISALLQVEQKEVIKRTIPEDNPILLTLRNPNFLLRILDNMGNIAVGKSLDGREVSIKDQLSAAKFILQWSGLAPSDVLKSDVGVNLGELRGMKKQMDEMVKTLRELRDLENGDIAEDPCVRLPGEDQTQEYEIESTIASYETLDAKVGEEFAHTQKEEEEEEPLIPIHKPHTHTRI